MNRRHLLTSVSAIALAAMLPGQALAQTRQQCPPHMWVLWGQDYKTGRYVMKCMKCGLFKIG